MGAYKETRRTYLTYVREKRVLVFRGENVNIIITSYTPDCYIKRVKESPDLISRFPKYYKEDYAIAGGCNESKEEGNQIDRKLISFIKIIAIH